MIERLNCVFPLLCCILILGTDVAAQTVAQLTLTPGLPPGPLDTLSNQDPMPPGRFTHRRLWQLLGVNQIPSDAVIQEVRVQRISSGTFEPGVLQAKIRPALSNGVDVLQVTTGVMGDPADVDPLEVYGVNSYVQGGGRVYTSNPFTGLPWTRSDLTTLFAGFWAKWENLGSQSASTQRLSLNDFTVEVVYEKLTVTGPSTVWSFGGANPAGWSTSIVLTSSRGSSTSWSIVSGSDKVSLSSSTGGQVTVSSTPAVISAAIGDIVIRATSGTETADHAITERAPYSLESSAQDVTTADPVYTYMTRIEYRIRDQFFTTMPSVALPINEQWTTAVIDDYPKNNWRRGAEAGHTIMPAEASRFVDGIGGEIPSRRPTPILDPASTTAIHHWGQAWLVGSTSIGVGRRVQTNVLQKNIGRALHTNIISPP